MECDDIRKKLSDHCREPLITDDKAGIDLHIRNCSACTNFVAEIEKTIRILRDLEEIEPPAGLARKVMDKIRAEARPGKTWIDKLFFPLHIKLTLEAMATVLITIAAIIIYRGMGPELRQLDVQPQAPALKSMPAEPATERQKEDMQQPEHLREVTKHKDSLTGNKSLEISTINEAKSVEQIPSSTVAAPNPAPAHPSAPADELSPAVRQVETGEASGMAAQDERVQRTAPAVLHSERVGEKKVDSLKTFTVMVKTPDAAKKEIEAYIARIGGELKILAQAEPRIIITVKLDPAKIDKFLALLDNLGTMKDDRQAFDMQSGLFRLIIEKQ